MQKFLEKNIEIKKIIAAHTHTPRVNKKQIIMSMKANNANSARNNKTKIYIQKN
jgi:hypothetical protein